MNIVYGNNLFLDGWVLINNFFWIFRSDGLFGRRKKRSLVSEEESDLDLFFLLIIVCDLDSVRSERGIFKNLQVKISLDERRLSSLQIERLEFICDYDDEREFYEDEDDVEVIEVRDIFSRYGNDLFDFEKLMEMLDQLAEEIFSFDFVFLNFGLGGSRSEFLRKYYMYDFFCIVVKRFILWKNSFKLLSFKLKIVRMNFNELMQEIDRYRTVELFFFFDEFIVQVFFIISEEVRSFFIDDFVYIVGSSFQLLISSSIRGDIYFSFSYWVKLSFIFFYDIDFFMSNFFFFMLLLYLRSINFFNMGGGVLGREFNDIFIGSQMDGCLINGIINSRCGYEKSFGYGSEYDFGDRFSLDSGSGFRVGFVFFFVYSVVFRSGFYQIKLFFVRRFQESGLDDYQSLQRFFREFFRIDVGVYERSFLISNNKYGLEEEAGKCQFYVKEDFSVTKEDSFFFINFDIFYVGYSDINNLEERFFLIGYLKDMVEKLG